jgi:hypothetical protein
MQCDVLSGWPTQNMQIIRLAARRDSHDILIVEKSQSRTRRTRALDGLNQTKCLTELRGFKYELR